MSNLTLDLDLAALSVGIVNIASVPHRSPFRYPGGKTWLVPRVRQWLGSVQRPSEFIEPFAGGAIVGLSVLFENLADRLLIVELDEDVAAVWNVILNGSGNRLASELANFTLTTETVTSVLEAVPLSIYDKAFATIIRNRVRRGGILADGAGIMKSGENGKGILSRWYPETIKRRIIDISAMQHRINFKHTDGIQVLRDNAHRTDAVFFIDPPYTVAGRRLYRHSEVDHAAIFDAAASLRGDFLITYDNSDQIARLAQSRGLTTRTIPMKNTHHGHQVELLIGRNLDWLGS